MNVLYCALLLLAVDAAEANPPARWPGFLGADASPVKAAEIPLTWSPKENIAWQAEIPGDGQSSPIVWDNTVVVTSVEGPLKDTYWLRAYSLTDGKPLWKHSLPSSDPVKSSLYMSRAAPTPVTDGRAIYAFFESGDVAAVSLSGKPLWNMSLSAKYGKFKNKFGLAASPVQTEDEVIVLVDDEGPSYLVALSKADGDVVWKTDRESRVSWSSPALVTIGGVEQVVCSSAGSVDGYDPGTGERLWTFAEVGGNTAATPLAFGDGRFLIGATVGREAERAEDAKKSNLAMTIETVSGKPTPKVLWRTEQATPSFGSPIVYKDHAYWVNRTGVIYCFDANTGEPRYTERTKQSCWATPVGIGDRVYFFGKDGITTVLAAGRKFEVKAENMLWNPDDFKPEPAAGAGEDTEEKRRAAANFSGPVQYGVAVVADSILMRTGNRLYCVRAH